MLLGHLANADLTLPAGAADVEIGGLSADSRAIDRGYLFAALPGSAADGADFAAEAVQRGAVAVLAETQIDVPSHVVVVRSDDVRRALAKIAARFHEAQPEKLVAVTGTSGKTSVVTFCREIFEAAGETAASIGTLGVVSGMRTANGNLTTPDPIALHATLDRLAKAGVTHAAIEASSHGLDQRRLDGIQIVAAGFTNLGRDHLDYHATTADYLAAKLRLFSTILPQRGTAVINMDGPYAGDVITVARDRGQHIFAVGQAGSELRLLKAVPDGLGQRLAVDVFGLRREIRLPLAGGFQASNALVATGLAIAAGIDAEKAVRGIEELVGARGRLELVGCKANGAKIFVDYAHKPDALECVLNALRPMTSSNLAVVLGAGGDRDSGKRPLMGEVAARLADIVIVTDDNPRSEDPAEIRGAIKVGAPDAIEIGDRASAIREAIVMLAPGDVLCIAGKGHETGQVVGTERLDFSDHAVVRSVLAGEEAA